MPLDPEQRFRYLQLKRKKAMSAGAAQVPQEPFYSQENPAPGAELRPPIGDTPWYEMGDDYKASQQGEFEKDAMFLAPGLPVPTNKPGVMLGAQAVGRGAADLVGAPIDLSTMALNAITGVAGLPPIEKPTFGGDDIASRFAAASEEVGYPVMDPNQMTPANKRMYETTRFASAGGAGGLTVASRAGKTSTGIGKSLTQPYENAPGRQIIDDTIAGGGAGAGFSAAQEMFPDSPLAQLAGALLGGGTASVGSRTAEGTVRAPFEAAYNRMDVQLPDGTKAPRRTVDDAATMMQFGATDPRAASQNIRQSIAEADATGTERLTTGLAADDVGLGGAEVRERLANSRAYQEKDQRIRTSASENINTLRNPDADIEAPQDLARQERDLQMTQVKAEADAAQTAKIAKEQEQKSVLQEREDILSPSMAERGREAEASKVLDEQIGPEGALGQRTQIKNQKFEDAAGEDTADISPIAESLKKVQAEINELGFENSGIPKGFENRVKKIMKGTEPKEVGVDPATGRKIFAEQKEGAGQAKLKDISKTRSEVSRAITKARKSGNFDLADNLQTLKKDINKMVDETASFEDAQKYYREEYAPFFAQGYGKTYRDTVQRADERTGAADPGNVAKIFLEGTPDAAYDLKKIVDIAPDKQAANAAVEKYMTADFASRFGTKASPVAIKNWIKSRSSQLDNFPDVKRKFEDLAKNVGSKDAESSALKVEIELLNTAFKRAEKNILATERRINSGTLGALINKDPDRYIESIMNKDDTLQKLDDINKLIGDNKAAKEGLKKAVTEHMLNQVTGTNVKAVDNIEGPLKYATLAKIVKENEDALKKVYSPEEMNTIRRSQKMLESYGNISRKALDGSATAERQASKNLATVLETAFRLKYGVLKAGGIMRTIRGAADLLPDGRIAKADRLVARAIFDPELGAHLLDTPTRDVGSASWNKKLNLLIGASAIARDENEEEELD